MHYSQDQLFSYLDNHHIVYRLYRHGPVFSCEQAMQIVEQMKIPGMPIKNLFLKDSKKNLYHIIACYNTEIDLKKISKIIKAKDLRFADSELLLHHLGVTPGSVTPFALLNDYDKVVQPIIDAHVLAQTCIQVHPLKNDATIVVSVADVTKFLQQEQRSYLVYDFDHHQVID